MNVRLEGPVRFGVRFLVIRVAMLVAAVGATIPPLVDPSLLDDLFVFGSFPDIVRQAWALSVMAYVVFVLQRGVRLIARGRPAIRPDEDGLTLTDVIFRETRYAWDRSRTITIAEGYVVIPTGPFKNVRLRLQWLDLGDLATRVTMSD